MEAIQATNPESSGNIALQRCDELIYWYEKHKRRQRIIDNTLQKLVILAAGLTAITAAIDTLPKWMVVFPAVITTIATGLSVNFRFRSKYVNFAFAGERLKWAKLRYQIRAKHVTDDATLLEAFVDNMEAIVSAELAEWREGLLTGDLRLNVNTKVQDTVKD